jgi:hypothetical protein
LALGLPISSQQIWGTHSISTNKPFASDPVKRSSTAPPGLTLRNHLNLCLAPSGMREVIGYAEVICQSWTERDTSSYTSASPCSSRGLAYDHPRRARWTHTSLLGEYEINLRSHGPWSKDETSSILVMYGIYHSAEFLLVKTRGTFGKNFIRTQLTSCESLFERCRLDFEGP